MALETHDLLRFLRSVVCKWPVINVTLLTLTSSPMGNDRSPEIQHNVGDTIIYDAQKQTVFNLCNFKWDHFHSISDENKTLSNISPFT